MKTSKMLSVFLMSVLLLAAALPFTASAAGDSSITINYPAGHSIDGQVFKAYKIFSVTTDGESFAYTIDPRFASFTGYPGSGTQTLHKYLTDGAGTIDDAAMTALAKALWTYIGDMTPNAQATGTTEQSVTLSDLDYGYYLTYSAGAVPGKDAPVVVVAANGLVTAVSGNVVINAKVDSPTLDKSVSNSTTGTWEDWADIEMGQTAQFRLTSAVPNMTGYDTYAFIVHDAMTVGLTFNDDVAVKVNGAAYTYFTVQKVTVTPAIAPDTFRVTFDPAEFVKLTPGHAIEITYSAAVNANAVADNSNKVHLEYSNNPYTSETGKTPEETINVYNFDLEIFKYTGTLSNAEALANAEFELRTGSESGTPVNVTDLSGGNYRLAVPADAAGGIKTKMVTAADGSISIRGLDAGSYTLVETAPPDGFNILTKGLKIEILHENADGVATITVDSEPSTIINVLNNKGPEFPGTGGAGTTIFYIVSAILTAGLAAFFILRKRKSLLAAE